MYLLCFEDGTMKTSTALTDDIEAGVEAGVMDVVNMVDGTRLTLDGEWVKIEPVEAD